MTSFHTLAAKLYQTSTFRLRARTARSNAAAALRAGDALPQAPTLCAAPARSLRTLAMRELARKSMVPCS